MPVHTAQPGDGRVTIEDEETTRTGSENRLILFVVGLVLTAAVPVALYLFVGETAGLIGCALPALFLLRAVPKLVRHGSANRRWEPARLHCDEWPIVPGRPVTAHVTRPRRDGRGSAFGDTRASLVCIERAAEQVGSMTTEAGSGLKTKESIVHRQACPVRPSTDGGADVELSIDPLLPPSMRLGFHRVHWRLEVEAEAAGPEPLSFDVTVAAAVADGASG